MDLFHAREHLHGLARVLEFMLGDQRDQWLAARLEDLDYGDIDGICAAARAYPLVGSKKDDLDKALGYFENNAPRMRYKWFRSRGLFTGSGVVSRVQSDRRPAPQAVRHEMDRCRSRRHHRPALPRSQQPMAHTLCPRQVWPDGEVDVDQAVKWIDGDVPADSWRELAGDFLERLKK